MSKESKEKLSNSLKALNRIGEKAVNWKGGLSFEPYNNNWTDTLKRSIRERDNYICQVCSKYGWVIHHIDYNKKNCSPENLICLCKSCHAKTNHNRNKWIEYFKNVNKN